MMFAWPADAHPNSGICEHARQYDRVILTNDLDFPQLLAHTRAAAPSIVLVRGEPLIPESRGESLAAALRDSAETLLAGAIVSIDWTGIPRARVLPL